MRPVACRAVAALALALLALSPTAAGLGLGVHETDIDSEFVLKITNVRSDYRGACAFRSAPIHTGDFFLAAKICASQGV